MTLHARRTAIRCGIASIVLMGASVIIEASAQTPPAAETPIEDKDAKKDQAARPPVKPVPVESTTPQDAARRAADPKDPSGALIVEPAKKP